MKKKRNTGCCFLFACILFLLPGVILLRDHLPDTETILSVFGQIRNSAEELLESSGISLPSADSAGSEDSSDASGSGTASQEEIQALLAAGQEENGCSYYYWTLDESLRAEYMKLLNGIRSMESSISLSVDGDTRKEIFRMVFADHPELFYAQESYDYTLYFSSVEIRPRYTCSAEEKEQRAQLIEQTVQEAVTWIPENASAYEIAKALYSYVVRTVEYDLNSTDNQNIYSSMVNRSSVCTGYAKELQYLLQRVGIQALLVEGEVTDQGLHAWLIASIDGEYYHIDPTFGDPSYLETSDDNLISMPDALQVDYEYLCCDDASLLTGRTVSDDLPVPACSSSAYLYYPLQGLYFYSYGEDVLISLQDSIDQGNTWWEGQFADEASYQEMLSAMQQGDFANLILANHPEYGSVRLHMSYRNESRVIKMWY